MAKFNGKFINPRDQNYYWLTHLHNLYLINYVPKYSHYTYFLREAVEWIKANKDGKSDEI